MNENMRTLNINGYASCTGGEFYKVNISGKGKITGDIKCYTFNSSGQTNLYGNLISETMDSSGVLKVIGDINSKTMELSGVNKIEGNFRGNELKCEGTLKIKNDIECENINIIGLINNEGFINCETMAMNLWGTSNCNEIGGSKVIIESNENSKSIFNMFIPKKFKENRLIASSIEGDDICIENCSIKIIKGRNIKIGVNCIIDEVEYSESIDIDKSSNVKVVNKV